MDQNTRLDDTQTETTGSAASQGFSQHGTPVQPVSSEDAIRQDAANVVPSIPLLGEHDSDESTAIMYAPDRSEDISDLTAEDIREDY